MSNDQVNACFELGGAIATCFSIRRLWAHREVRGVSYIPWVFFTVWGLWNIPYYHSLEQMWSVGAALCMVIANITWLLLAFIFQKGLSKCELI